jgi:hypothetical protein
MSSISDSRLFVFFGTLSIAVFLVISPAAGQEFRPDDPLWIDPDNISIPKPTERPLSKTIDLLQKTFTTPKVGTLHAQNVNTVGGVPDSSWFTNRMSSRIMSLEELIRGPNQGPEPDQSKPWVVIGAKTEGATPGLLIRDARGDVYFIKYDPLYWPYHVPQNYLVRWKPVYEIDKGAEVLWESGHVERLTRGYVRDLLEDIPVRPDGTIQVLASKFLDGEPLGPFDFQGTRSDDPNDIFPHQDRREIRALRIFAAWMNHNDSDSVNTLDMYHTGPGGERYVKHHLIDFGTILGSGATQPHARRVGNEYYISFEPALKSAGTLGLWDRDWRKIKYQEYRSVGRFESNYFRPEKWIPDYPNPAFDKMTLEDAFWATRIVMRFSDEAIRAIVNLGQYDDPEAQEHVAETIIKRRDKIVQYYLSQLNPLDDFRVADSGTSSSLEFDNLGLEAGLASSCRYTYQWHSFDNLTGQTVPIGTPGVSEGTAALIPDSPSDFLQVSLSSQCSEQPKWSSSIEVFLRSKGPWQIVGIRRQ